MESYGPVDVTLLREDVLASYTIRTLKIHHTRLKCPKQQRQHADRYVLQYHFTSWPDSGVAPDDPLPLLNFIRKSSGANRESDRPIVVHCRYQGCQLVRFPKMKLFNDFFIARASGGLASI